MTRKQLYDLLEAFMNGTIDPNTAKGEIAKVYDAMKAYHKTIDDGDSDAKKKLEALTNQVTELSKTKDKTTTEKTETEKALEIVRGELASMKAKQEESDKKALETAKKEKDLNLYNAFGDDLKKGLGSLTGDLLLKNMIADGRITMNDKGEPVMLDGGVTYSKTEAIARLQTAHKDEWRGEDGTKSKGGNPSPTGDKDLFGMSSHELFSMSIPKDN
jgi:hypothetical protein